MASRCSRASSSTCSPTGEGERTHRHTDTDTQTHTHTHTDTQTHTHVQTAMYPIKLIELRFEQQAKMPQKAVLMRPPYLLDVRQNHLFLGLKLCQLLLCLAVARLKTRLQRGGGLEGMSTAQNAQGAMNTQTHRHTDTQTHTQTQPQTFKHRHTWTQGCMRKQQSTAP